MCIDKRAVQEQLRGRQAAAAGRAQMSFNPGACGACGHKLAGWHDDGGSYATFCDDCNEEICSACAAFFEAEGGYGDDGQGARIRATCKACRQADGDPDAQRDAAYDDKFEDQGSF